jgi:hypothetical protein
MTANYGYISAGGSQYGSIVIPPCHLMPASTLKQLTNLQRQGVIVIFEKKLPDDVPGYADLVKRRKDFQATIEYIRHGSDVIRDPTEQPAHLPDGIVLTQNVISQSVPWVDADLVAALSKAESSEVNGIRRESMTDFPGIHFIRRSYPGGYYYFITNQGTGLLDNWVRLATSPAAIEIMDPMTGRTGIAPLHRLIIDNPMFRLRLEPGHSIILRTFQDHTQTGPEWHFDTTGNPIFLAGKWNIQFIEGGPTLPSPILTDTLKSWTELGGADTQTFAGTALYSIDFNAPRGGYSNYYSIDLGKVCQSARVRLNGKSLGTLIIPPWRTGLVPLLPKGNHLEVEVTNTSANRIRDLDVRHIPWKIFYPPNLLSVHYTPFDASGWQLTDSGLIGPVTLIPESAN